VPHLHGRLRGRRLLAAEEAQALELGDARARGRLG
jgi:hypothetical protein